MNGTTIRPVVVAAGGAVRRTLRALLADLLAVFALGMLFGFLWWGAK